VCVCVLRSPPSTLSVVAGSSSSSSSSSSVVEGTWVRGGGQSWLHMRREKKVIK
jgi:hypothetical protein